MKAVLPGRPESRLQALATGYWNSRRVTAYISGNAFSILGEPDTLIQTIYDDDEDALQSIALDEAMGKIAVCTQSSVRIYKPFGWEEHALQWALQSSFPIHREKDDKTPKEAITVSLSWGTEEELLVAHTNLELYRTSKTTECSWRKRLAGPVRTASISYDSAYIASIGLYDKLVKVWRRLSFGSDDVRFDFMYLPHPELVTNLQWRRPRHLAQTVDNVLYTFCLDNQLRIWTGTDSHHGQQNLRLWGKLDLASCIQTRTIDSKATAIIPSVRWAFMMHGRDLSAATETAVQDGEPSPADEDVGALDHLIAVANRSPEICVVLDGRGQMSAWALENVGCKTQKSNTIFNAAHVTSMEFDFLKGSERSTSPPHVEAYAYCNTGGHLHILLHFFDGRVEVYRSNIASLFNPNPRAKHLTRVALWTGHSRSIRKIVRNFSGRAIVSRTQDGQCMIWKHELGGAKQTSLSQQGVVKFDTHIHRMCVLRKGRFVVFLQHEKISLWDCRQEAPKMLDEIKYDVPGKPLCLLILPRHEVGDYTTAHIATITSDKHGVVWEVRLPFYLRGGDRPTNHNGVTVNGHNQQGSLKQFVQFELEDAGDLAYVLPVDPAGASPVISGFLDVFARDVAVSYTHSGRVEFWTARVNHAGKRVDWLSTSSMETGVNDPALVSGSTMKKAALVDSARAILTIWDIRGARLEYEQSFETHHRIQDLDWTSTPDSQSILAVGFPHRILLLSEMRFDYLNKGPAWAPVREISTRDLTPHPIGDSVWLGDGHLVIGAGNQLFVHDRQFDVSGSLITSLRLPNKKDGKWDLFDVVQRLNGPLPVFHPQFLSQCMLAGKIVLVHSILMALHRTLKYWVEGEVVDDYLGMKMEEFYAGAHEPSSLGIQAGEYFSRRRMSYDEGEETFTEDIAAAINERLTRVGLPQLSGHEQIQLVDIVECVGLVEKQRRSLDENGARFMLFFRQHALRKGRTSEIHMSWREINWAYHSGSQDILLDFVSKQHHGRLVWEDARESGIFLWLTDAAALRAQFETIARNEYTRGEPKNPVDCSLFYLALKKKTVLQGLWRMASWNKEQSATQRFLSNNFEDPKWRTAALKNAYALLSKRRFMYAAAFFLLADRLQDAVNVCLNQIKDLQLAIAIARVYEGDQGPVLRRLLEEEILTIAAQEGNRWLASWAFWVLHRRDMAVRALVTPVYTLLETPGSPDLKSKSFLTDDPALIVLYSQLRVQTLQTLRGATKVTPKVEWDFVLHNARLYDRMGCDLLGLDLVRNWEFLKPSTSIAVGFGGEINPLKLLKRRSSLVVADLPLTTPGLGASPAAVAAAQMMMPAEMKSGGVAASAGGGGPGGGGLQKPKPPPTVFEEPDASSLLDSFGF